MTTHHRVAFRGGAGSALVRRGVPDAPALLFIHPANLQAACWTGVIDHLPADWNRVAIDLSGHGGSARASAYGVVGWAAECAELAAALGLGRVHVVGASAGAPVAVALALAHPELVVSLTTVGGAFEPLAEQEVGQLAELIRAGGGSSALGAVIAAEPGLDEAARRQVMDDVSVNDAAQAIAIWRAAGAAEGLSNAHRLSCRTLAVVGELDAGCPPAGSAAFAAASGGRLAVLPGHGHLPMYSAPAELAHLIREHLSEGK
ncbi:hypothetical protein C1I98_04010 [Spongiactinospora gelatinilytica]|uniref:AB hydrolase-1 domain-containing protein n=1 Tax=Spongiactinospora gelatinilytica TaxID=2666298 RepID=A0A2W2I8J2_9ACTN|nr:alpha/beta hydrolase [Spongiactinospora gelatinilytica]PZG54427.1 hypothetical protein C1I98_04010 [Spongiactinospora gelatinilytica]